MSKKISVERQHGFLQKISAHVDEERKNKEARKVRKEKGSGTSRFGTGVGGNGKKAKGVGDTRKAGSVPQVHIYSNLTYVRVCFSGCLYIVSNIQNQVSHVVHSLLYCHLL